MNHIDLLKSLIATPSLSRQEDATARIIFGYLQENGCEPRRCKNNVWCVGPYSSGRPTLLLNSHHDTVKPASSYTRDPFEPKVEGDRLYGLGSNDAGASAVALIETFIKLKDTALPFNLILAITAEEEVGGENGMRAFLPHLEENGFTIDAAIVGEPTGLQAAVGERGLVVLDCVTHGVTGHAARNEGVNAIYLAMEDIDIVRNYQFPRISELLGPITLNVTQINAGWAHNAIPDECRWVVDVRTTVAYTNQETVDILQGIVKHSTLTPRSTRVQASLIDESHPLVEACKKMGISTFVSPTTSDMSLMHDFPSLKIGPGESSRSHSADEFVLLSEIDRAITTYTQLITSLTSI